jgi:ABC-type ATPase involved in cell division
MRKTPFFLYNNPGMIQLYHLTQNYPSGPLVFQDAYFSAPDASFVVFCGSNRSGKTTLLKLLCGEETPTSGLVLVSGRRIAEMTAEERQEFLKEVGLVLPDLGLMGDRTVEENLLIPLQLHEKYKAEEKRRVSTFLERIGLKGKEANKSSDLSLGEQRALLFVRALVSRPSLFLADEPFQGLDEPLIHTLLDLLLEMQKENGGTVVLATQDASLIARYAEGKPDLRIVWATLLDRRILPSEAPPC